MQSKLPRVIVSEGVETNPQVLVRSVIHNHESQILIRSNNGKCLDQGTQEGICADLDLWGQRPLP